MMLKGASRQRISRKVALFTVGAAMVLGLNVSCHTAPVGPRSPLPVEPPDAGPAVRVLPAMEKQAPARVRQDVRAGRGLADFLSGNFTGSSRCAACHDLLEDRGGNAMSISGHWRSTMMANAARDPLWLAKVSSEVSRNPALQKVIEEKCVTCHMPMAATEARGKGEKVALAGAGFLAPDSLLHQAAMDGVSCSLCHQIQDRNLGEKAGFSGRYTVDIQGRPPQRMLFGPYQGPESKTMRKSVGYTPGYGSHLNDSALCATCHTLYTPYVDAAGKVVGEFPEQTPFLEWKHSDFGAGDRQRHDIGMNPGPGRTCQECHMPFSLEGGVKIANYGPPGTRPKDPFAQHHFVGGNVFMLNLLQDNSRTLGITASTAKLEDSRQRTIVQLRNDTAEIVIAEARMVGGELLTGVAVVNKVGHKFPTGFPTRNAWIHLTVTSGDGELVFESGRPLADGRISGNDADRNQATFEPHYTLITSPDQVQIYETIMGNSDGAVTHTLLRAAAYLKDNRLLPRGFDKDTAQADIGVYGRAAADPDFTGGSDRITYQIKANGRPGPFLVQAELLYRPLTYSFIKDLREDRHLPLVERFIRQYDRADKRPVTVAMDQTRVQ
ncbi:MAG: hypothetical protein L3J03_11745 [Desulfobacterales bacterium]|nr:hypothetical protein [Desulfobacterales bacterium]